MRVVGKALAGLDPKTHNAMVAALSKRAAPYDLGGLSRRRGGGIGALDHGGHLSALFRCYLRALSHDAGQQAAETLPQKISVLLSDGAHARRSMTPPTRALSEKVYLSEDG